MDVYPALVAVYSAPPLDHPYPFQSVGISDGPVSRFNESRVIVHKNRLIVGADSPRGPQAVFSEELAEELPRTQGDPFLRFLTVSGGLVVVARSKGCGCGSRLRSWNPYGSFARSSRG